MLFVHFANFPNSDGTFGQKGHFFESSPTSRTWQKRQVQLALPKKERKDPPRGGGSFHYFSSLYFMESAKSAIILAVSSTPRREELTARA